MYSYIISLYSKLTELPFFYRLEKEGYLFLTVLLILFAVTVIVLNLVAWLLTLLLRVANILAK